MTPSWNESPVALDKLDGHLKALLRLKIREFVHLSPWFKNISDSQVCASNPSEVRRGARSPFLTEVEDCPHRKHEGRIGRRYVRVPLHGSER